MPRTLAILGVTGDPARSIKLRIAIPTARNGAYPQERQEISEVDIVLPENYPFPPGPFVTFTTPIWNPNVYPSGKWCFGEWKVTENLELFVMRLMKVIALDPSIVNPHSAANVEAAGWFVRHLSLHPERFPTVSLSELMMVAQKPSIVWRSIK
jgi:ubiquitin-protein ligase